ncbi:MAG: N-acylneuraminate-9-phosphate synthase [Verrucomicrobia bacterium]|nr:N-acylneuraminate-9-phosphate synthase [Verrucomicrobiota bacterium]MBT7699279.1 N-acylneuraminate-9-phosphate synthase [Verrucomicrobiota bacterium]
MELRDSTRLEDFGSPYVVAEVNAGHSGNIETAKAMISQAQQAGCDCIKFQSWSAETLYSKTYYDSNPIAKRMVDAFSFSEAELSEAATYSKECGIAFSSTPYSLREVDFLLEVCGAPFVKVASMDLTNTPFLEHIARSGAPIVLSTGMGELTEIRKAVDTIVGAGNENICLLHCIAIYPPATATIRLNNILGLREEFPGIPIGFSDHSIGIEMASAATALGACIIEKHFTLDRQKIGMDNQIAVEPEEMAQLVQNCHNIQTALGDRERVVLPAEMAQREKMRRSIVAVRDLEAGTELTAADMDAKRPGTGLSPDRVGELVGKVLLHDVEADTLIMVGDVAE